MVLLALSASVMPHHHHLSKICFAIERCVTDGQVNDEHTSHPSSHDSDPDDCPAQGVQAIKAVKTLLDTGSQLTPPPAATEVAVCAVPTPELTLTMVCASMRHVAAPQGWKRIGKMRGPPTI